MEANSDSATYPLGHLAEAGRDKQQPKIQARNQRRQYRPASAERFGHIWLLRGRILMDMKTYVMMYIAEFIPEKSDREVICPEAIACTVVVVT
jgi:hypothetical protein